MGPNTFFITFIYLRPSFEHALFALPPQTDAFQIRFISRPQPFSSGCMLKSQRHITSCHTEKRQTYRCRGVETKTQKNRPTSSPSTPSNVSLAVNHSRLLFPYHQKKKKNDVKAVLLSYCMGLCIKHTKTHPVKYLKEHLFFI